MQVYQLHLQGMFLMKITRWTAFFIQNTRLSTQQRISTMIRTFIPNIPYRKISINFNITFCVSLWYLRIYPVEKCAHFWQFTFHPFWGTVTLHFLQWSVDNLQTYQQIQGHYCIWKLASLLHLFYVKAGSAALAAIPICHKSWSTHFSSMHCS